MPNVVHRFDSPDRFVAGTVGQPGERAFFLQAREGNRITSVACEKQQVLVLAENLEKVLDEVNRRGAAATSLPPSVPVARDNDPLDAPITEEFRVGTMTLAWDAEAELVVIEMFSTTPDAVVEEDEETEPEPEPEPEPIQDLEVEADEVFVVKITPRYARDFVARANALVSAGRPACPFCLQPIDPDGHICPRANGYRRALF
ncbi:MAG: DUF3090 domain-containing protein [Propionibacteriaceae bacterium]